MADPNRPTMFSLLWPLGCGLAAILIALAPFGEVAKTITGPHWLLMALSFWASRRPWSTPPALVFTLGLIFDLLRDGPVGAELFALLVAVEALRGAALRMQPRSFYVEWLRFSLAAVAFEAMLLTLLAVTYSPAPPLAALATRAGAAMVLYPILAYALQRLSGARIGEGRFAHL